MAMSEQVNELAAALAKAQAVMPGAKKDQINPHFKSRFADLASVWDACRAPLAENGLSVVQALEPAPEGALMLVSTLLHTSGQWINSTVLMPLAKPDPQGYGSAITYARRYALAALVGVAPEDDDGNAASQDPNGGHYERQQAAPAAVGQGRPPGAQTTPRPAMPPQAPTEDDGLDGLRERLAAEYQKSGGPKGAPAFYRWITTELGRDIERRDQLTREELVALLATLAGETATDPFEDQVEVDV
jgi:hypothetical protein